MPTIKSRIIIPNKVYYGANIIEVVVKPIVVNEGKEMLGLIEYDKQRISLSSENHVRPEKTLIHEIVHAILIKAGKKTESTDETLVDALSEGLYDVLMQNTIVVPIEDREELNELEIEERVGNKPNGQ